MAELDSKSNAILRQLIANSLFTPRQLTIISKRLQGRSRMPSISSGAYYRQVKQCRNKVIGVLYSMLLLQLTGVLQPEALSALGRLGGQLDVILNSRSDDIVDDARLTDVISVMGTLVKRISRL